MNKHLKDIPVSVLDLATIIEGDTPADAFRKSLQLAQHAEQLGFRRYWFAEHHNMESIASAATSVLIGYIAGGTSKIRVGSGGVMLPNHAPLLIAEQFGTLESLYPGRIDLGLGRAPGTDPVTSRALRRSLNATVDDFPNDVMELRQYFHPGTKGNPVRAIPGEGLEVPIWLLGSSTFSAQLAALMGLPFAFASHFAPTYLLDALQLYRKHFTPSDEQEHPYSMACVNVIAADSDAAAHKLATSFYMLALGLIRNHRKPLSPPLESMEGKWTDYEQAAVHQMMQYTFIGAPQTIEASLQQFLDTTGVDEIMVTTHVYDLAAKKRSMEIVASMFRKS